MLRKGYKLSFRKFTINRIFDGTRVFVFKTIDFVIILQSNYIFEEKRVLSIYKYNCFINPNFSGSQKSDERVWNFRNLMQSLYTVDYKEIRQNNWHTRVAIDSTHLFSTYVIVKPICRGSSVIVHYWYNKHDLTNGLIISIMNSCCVWNQR